MGQIKQPVGSFTAGLPFSTIVRMVNLHFPQTGKMIW
jgi:hypothetical protein